MPNSQKFSFNELKHSLKNLNVTGCDKHSLWLQSKETIKRDQEAKLINKVVEMRCVSCLHPPPTNIV